MATRAGSWGPANANLTATEIRALAIDPTTPLTVYAGTHTNGVFKSTDGGASWNPANAGLGSLVVNALAVDPVTPTTLYAGTDGGLYTSVDAASSWTGPVSFGVFALAVDPATPGTLYFGTYGAGVFRSTNYGMSGSQLIDGLASHVVLALAVNPASPNTPYAGTIGGGVSALYECGDGTQQPGEECDDGNVTSNDGCSATCTLEPCRRSPTPLCRVALQAQMQLSENKPGKERLKLRWKKVSGSTTTAAFGDPVTGATRVTLCLYDASATLVQAYEVDRAGQQCAGKPCWATKGTAAYGYKDKLAAADGVTKIGYKAGASGKGKADAAGANDATKGQTALPTGVVAALTGNTRPTVQLSTSDGLCIEAMMTEVTKDEGGVYKARKK